MAMANHLRNLLQALNITGDVLEQAVLLVTNDNLDLGCAVIEKAATEKVFLIAYAHLNFIVSYGKRKIKYISNGGFSI